jgi:hypothetical protein
LRRPNRTSLLVFLETFQGTSLQGITHTPYLI